MTKFKNVTVVGAEGLEWRTWSIEGTELFELTFDPNDLMARSWKKIMDVPLGISKAEVLQMTRSLRGME